MSDYILIFFLLLISMSLHSQNCVITDSTPASCNCDDCNVINENWILTSNATNVCEGETFEIEAEYEITDEEVDFFRWAVYTLDFTSTLIDTTIFNNNLFEYKIELGDIQDCVESNDRIDFWLNLIVQTKQCVSGGVSCHNTLKRLTVLYKPRANFESAAIECVDATISFEDLSCFTGTFFWDFGNGQTSSDANPTVMYSASGSYTVNQTVTNGCGNDPETKQITVVDYPDAEIKMSVPSGELCRPDYLDLALDANQWVTGPSGTFNWSITPAYTNTSGAWCFVNPAFIGSITPCLHDSTFTESTVNSLLAFDNINLYFQESGSYEVKLDYGNVCGEDSKIDTIHVYEPPTITSLNAFNGCDEVNVCFDDLNVTVNGNYESVEWIFTNASEANSTDLDFGCLTFNSNGEISLSVNANDPCFDQNKTISVSVLSTQNVSIDNPNPNIICQNNGLIRLSPSVSGGEYIIDGSMASFIDNNMLDPSTLPPGDYTVRYVLSTDPNCPAEDDFSFTIQEVPAISLEDINDLCEDDVSFIPTFNSFGGDIDSWNWVVLNENGNSILTSTDQLPVFSVPPLGSYQLIVELFSNECGVFTDTSNINIQEKITPIIQSSTDSTICASDDNFILTTNIPGGKWTSTNCTISQNGEVDVELSGENNCIFQYTLAEGSACEQSATININIINLNDDISVPEALRICNYQTNYQISNFSPFGGRWSGQGIVDQANGIIDISQLQDSNFHIFTYCITSTEIACEACKETTLMLDELPETDFYIDSSPCKDLEFQIINPSTDNVINFSWNFGDGDTSTLKEPFHTFENDGDYTITLIATTAFGCNDTISKIIYVAPPPVMDVEILVNEGCAPLEIEYTNNSYGENAQQFWIIGGIDTLVEEQPNIVLDGVLTDSLVTIDFVISNDCKTLSSSKEVLVHPIPKVDFGINDDEGCSPDTVFFINNTQGLPDYFYWDFGNGITSTNIETTPQVYFSPDDSISIYYISLYARNSCDEDELVKEITVYPNNVDAFFELDTLFGCPPLEVNITNYATPGSSVSYDFGDGGTSNVSDTTYVYDIPGKYVITQYAALCGQDMFISDTITVLDLPEVDFSLPSIGCLGDSVKFNNLSQNAISSYWDFGDGNFSNLQNPTHIYQQEGNYYVSLIMYSLYSNCADTITKQISIPQLPSIEFEALPKQLCPGEVVKFQNLSTGAQNFEWQFGDNSGTEEENPTHQYNFPGEYKVVLTIYDELGCSISDTLNDLIVYEEPKSSFDILGEINCQFYDTILVSNTSSGFVNSIWYLNNELYSEQLNNIQLLFNESGNQQLDLISINAFECSDTSSSTFFISPSPIAQSNIVDTAGCQNFEIELINLSENSDLFYWMLDGSNSSVDSIFTHTYVESGNFQSQLIASNANGCPSDTAYINVNVFPRALSDFSVLPFDSCGLPKEIILNNLSNFSNDYDWDFGNGVRSTFFEPSITYQSGGAFDIILIASNEYKCPDTSSQSISIFPQPNIDISLPSFEICEGDTIRIVNSTINATNFTWQIDNSSVNEFPIMLTTAGEYSLTVNADYQNKCFDSKTFENKIEVFTKPKANFSYVFDEDELILGDVRFLNQSLDADYFLWEFGDGNSSNEPNPFHVYNTNGPLKVCLYAYNSNNGIYNCESIKCDLIIFEPIYTFFVPNALSPDNNYGNSEVGIFKPKGIGLKSYKLNIYSPWGDVVTTLREVIDGEPIDFWDGTFRGEPVPQGAYIWTATITYLNEKVEFKKGNVTVVR